MENSESIRLQVYLAKCGVGSRRKCEEFILDGQVSVNEEVITRLGIKVSGSEDIRFRGRRIKPEKQKIYVALHKPKGYLSSQNDPEGRPLAIDLLKPVIQHRLYNIGRLDYMSSGLLLFTNDGDFAQKIIHPSKRIEKEYIVVTNQTIPEELLQKFKRGHYTKGEFLKIKDYSFKGPRKVHIILEEGRNREIRKVFLARSLKITKLHRIRVGNVTLGNLQPGHFRHLTNKEIESFSTRSEKNGSSH